MYYRTDRGINYTGKLIARSKMSVVMMMKIDPELDVEYGLLQRGFGVEEWVDMRLLKKVEEEHENEK